MEIRESKSNNHSVITAIFDDSFICLVHAGEDTDEMGPRQVYAYLVMRKGEVISAESTLRSAVGAGVDMRAMLGTFASFAMADAERYNANMDGSKAEEWAYLNDSALLELHMQLCPEQYA